MKKEFIVPIRILSEANNSDHWIKKNKRKKIQQDWIHLICKREIHKFRLPVRVSLIRQAPRTLDYDNAVSALKWARDVVADLLIPGLAPGQADGSDEIEWKYDQEKKPKYNLKIVIENIYRD